ncbi:DNA helicase UvrD (plasmid) [Pseudomonas aeruginosa]|uniref:UvrD-helicase domain-containing protein n=1 Tax=Pseudomonas aeruginosa TaxID=287 RepID=UPI003752F5CB
MTAFSPLNTQFHLDPIFAGIASLNPHDGAARALAVDPRRSMVLLAPAGSGKTTTLQLRMLACLTVVERPEEVLAITFTNAAAAEIVERVIGALSLAAIGTAPVKPHELVQDQLARQVLARDKQLGWNLLLNPGRLRIMTFDSFCASLASKTPIMAGLGGGKTSDDPSLVYRQAILSTLAAVNDPDVPAQLLEALQAVLAFAKNRFEDLVPLFEVLLMKRDQWAGRILSLDIDTMTEAVARSVERTAEEAIAAISAPVITECMRCLETSSGHLEGFEWASSIPQLVPDNAGLTFLRAFSSFMLTKEGGIRTRVDSRQGFPAKHPLTKNMNELLGTIKESGESAAYASALQLLATLPDVSFPARSAEMVRHLTVILRYLLANLTLAFESTNSLDFPEVAQRAIQALGSGDSIGDALLEEDRISHILVDEFQDTNQAQYDLLKGLIDHWEEDDSRSIFMCGDGFQSIFLFRGADLNLFTSIVEAGSFGPKKIEVNRLVVNFRSLPGVVQWNNETYQEVFKGSAYEFVPSVAMREGEGGMCVHALATGPLGEAEAVVDVARKALADNPDQSVAVLVRGRSHLQHILPAFKAAGIEVRGQDIQPIGETQPVSELIALIRSFWHSADRTAWLSLLRSAFIGLSWADCLTVSRGGRVIRDALRLEAVQSELSTEGQKRVQALLQVIDSIERSARGAELAWAVKSAWIALGGPATVTRGEMDDIETIFRLLNQHTATGALVNPQAFFRAIEKVYASPKAGTVTVMTFHGSKGLEFDVVLIPGLSRTGGRDDTPLFHWRQVEGEFTIAPNLGDLDASSPESRLFSYVSKMVRKDQTQEVARTAYVATTRAREICHLFATVDRLPPVDEEEVRAVKAPAGSLLQCLWSALEDEVNQAEPALPISADHQTGVPSKARLAPGFEVKLPASVFVPAAANDQIPTENELSDELREQEGNDHRAKAIGIVYHWMVEQIGKQGLAGWSVERVKSKSQAVASLLRREGFPAAEIAAGVSRVVDLVCKTITCQHGRWLLQPRASAGYEVQVSSYRDGRWVHRVLDLSFVEEGVYFIPDYKTAECPEGMSVDAFVSNQVARYRLKMLDYARSVKDAGIDLPIRQMLYFPALGRLAEVS